MIKYGPRPNPETGTIADGLFYVVGAFGVSIPTVIGGAISASLILRGIQSKTLEKISDYKCKDISKDLERLE